MLNNLVITGRISTELELKVVSGNKKVLNFDIAHQPYGEKEKTFFLKVTAWGTRAEYIVKHFSKSKPIEIMGVLSNERFVDKKGFKRSEFSVVVDKVFFPLCNKADRVDNSDGYKRPSTGGTNYPQSQGMDHDPPF